MAKGGGSATYYMVGLVFALLVALTLLYVAYNQNQEVEKALAKVREADSKYEREHKAVEDVTKELHEARRLIHGRDLEVISYDHFKTTHLDPANKKLDEILSQEWIAIDDWRNIQDPAIKGRWEELSKHKAERGGQSPTNLTQVINELYDELTAVIQIIPRMRYDRIAAREEVEAIRGNMVRDVAAKQREIDELRGEKNTLTDQNIQIARQFDLEKKRLQDDKDNILKERSRLERDFRLEEARLASQVSQLEGRIEDLTKQQTRSFAETASNDGEVVYADASLGYAWINIGRRQGLRRNTRFQVYQVVKGGMQRIKGVIEVRRVDEDMSQCAIIENQDVKHPITGEIVHVPNPNDPVVKGDLIRNPFFDADQERTFVFLGSKLQNRYYNLQEIQRKLEEVGAKVDKKISQATNFVILLGEADEDADMQEQIKQASRFGVIFMREDELLEYLGR